MIVTAFLVLSILGLFAISALLHAAAHAPEGHENEFGFVAVREPVSTDTSTPAESHREESDTHQAA